MLLITGCPRSGTSYMSRTLTGAGIIVAHEEQYPITHEQALQIDRRRNRKMSQRGSRPLRDSDIRTIDGIASWPLASRSNKIPWGPQYKDFSFDVKLHQVRNPLMQISSDPFSSREESRQFLSDVLGLENIIPNLLTTESKEDITLFHMIIWREWNLMAEKFCDWTYKIEDFPNITREFCEKIKMPEKENAIREQIKTVPKDVNSRKYVEGYKLKSRLTWKDLEAVDKSLTHDIKEQAIRYGYSI